MNWYQVTSVPVCVNAGAEMGEGGLLYMYRFVRHQIWFFSHFVWNRVSILTIFVSSTVWFVHSSLELGMFLEKQLLHQQKLFLNYYANRVTAEIGLKIDLI